MPHPSAPPQKPEALNPEQIARQASGRASWHRKASKPISIWLMVLLVSVFVHRWIPNSIWFMVHLVTLGVISNNILIWSQHFTEALLKNRLPDTARRYQLARIYTLNISIVLLMLGMVFMIYPLTLVGSIGVGGAVTWHGLAILRQIKSALPSRFGATVRYYVVAAWLLPFGALFGAILGGGKTSAAMQGQLLVAHEAVNILGFVGITVVGTLITLWPTMLRTKMHPSAVAASRNALTLMGAGILIATLAALVGFEYLAATGFLLYALGLLIVGLLMVRTCATKKPSDYPTLSVSFSLIWLFAGVLWAVVLLFTLPFAEINLRVLTPVFVVGFLLQLVLGAMSYLLPVRMGGGPAAVRASNKEFNRFSYGRVLIINLCLLIFVLPADWTGTWIRTTTSILGALTLAAFLPLMLRGVKKSVAARKEVIAARARGERPAPQPEGIHPQPANKRRELLLGGLAVAGVTVLGTGVNISQNGLRLAQGATVPATGQSTRLKINATADMRFNPDTVEVPAGNELILEITNTDTSNVHDLVLANGTASGRINPGETKTLTAGIISKDVEGWCSIIGHRQMGMVFQVKAVGLTAGAHQHSAASGGAGSSEQGSTMLGSQIDLAASPSEGFSPRSAVLEPVPQGEIQDGATVHTMVFDVSEINREIAPGVNIQAWTYNGQYMGPVLHGNLGDIFEVELINNGTMGHSIDFHAGMISPNDPMRTIAPGERLTYRFEARGSGIWLYHCSTMPMSSHIASGMFGAVVINPDSLAPVEREYILVQNETYLTDTRETTETGAKITQVDPAGFERGIPTLTMFNGHANQYRHAPLEAKVGQRVRIWVLAAGPSKGTSFHVVGTQFDTVYKEGAYLLREGRDAFGVDGGHAQSLDLASAQGGFVEMEFLEAGTYTFVNHDFAEMERGAMGKITVTD